MIALEPMNHDKQVDTNKVRCNLLGTLIKLFQYLLLTELLSVFDHLNKFVVVIDAVAFLKYDGTHFNVLLLHGPQCSNPQLRGCVQRNFVLSHLLLCVLSLD